jgi:hypothetical protein
VKLLRLILLLGVSFLFSCAARLPEIPMSEVPAGPLMQALERRAHSFASLKSVATLEFARKDRRRVFENAGVLVRGRDRFLIEAYGPLGQTAASVLWNGRDVVLDLDGTRRVLPGGAGLERLLGSQLDPADLADVLAGNIPGMARATSTKLRCAENGACLLELASRDLVVRVRPAGGGNPTRPWVRSCDVLRRGSLVYQVRYESAQDVGGYILPTRIIVENIDKQVSLTIQYSDPEVNVPVDERDFEPAGGEG